MDCSLALPTWLFWLSSYVASHHSVVAPKSSAKDQFYFSVYYLTLNSNCEVQRASKNLKKIVEDRVRSQNELEGSFKGRFL